MDDYLGNITAAGVRRRQLGGVIGLVIAVALFAALVIMGAPRIARLFLILPLGMAAIGFFQAREKTCVALGAVGTREVEGGGTCPLQEHERGAVRARVRKVFAESVITAAVVTAIATWV